MTYNLDLPRIGAIANRLRAGGMEIEDTMSEEKLAEEIARCVLRRSV